MRFDSIKIHGVGPFKDVDLDLSTLAGKLTAVTGQNGAGKTTLLELLAGALFRECPTRGTLANLATTRDAYVEVGVTNGSSHVVRQLIDNLSGKGESLVLNAAGEPVLESAKVSAADKWIAAHLPAADVLYSSSFSVQGRRGFLDLSKAERRALLVELLGLKRFEALAGEASSRAGAVRAELALLRSRLSGLPDVDVAALCEEALACQGRATTATEDSALARRSLERARAAAGDAERARELVEQRRGVERRIETAKVQIADTETRIANNQGLLARGDEIRAAVLRIEAIKMELAKVSGLAFEARGAVAAHFEKSEEAAKRFIQAGDAMRRAEARVRSIEARLKDREMVEAAAAKVRVLAAMVADYESQFRDATTEVERLQQLLVSGKDGRITLLRDGLELIAHTRDDDAPLSNWAASTLAGDDKKAEESDRAPQTLSAAQGDAASALAALKRANGDLANARALAARVGEIETAENDLVTAKVELAEADEAARAAGVARKASLEPSPAEAQLAELRVKQGQLNVESEQLRVTADLGPRLEQATALIEERKGQLAQQRETLAAAERELAGLPVVDFQQVDLVVYERDLKAKEQAALDANAAWTRAQDAAKLGEETAAKRAVLATEIAQAETKLADYTRLAQDFGPSGVPLMEIDAALPELSAVANSLLHEFLGSRFTVELRTDRLSADGKKSIDGLDVVVLDTQNGREAQAETFSGGEVVLIGSALSLALTTLACRRSAAEDVTLVLDEAGAALDDSNARAWIGMVRRAANQIGASRVLLVSHSDDIKSLCDSRIEVGNGMAVIS